MAEQAHHGDALAVEEPAAVELRWHGVLLRALSIEASELDGIVTRMFASHRRDAVRYWLELLLAMGIATLGLALGSTAVVIGAMLIAPLMGPILGLGMALVVGSPALTVRSLGRTAGSIAAVVGGAALLTIALPFHELNPEITSRTFPTALDLLIAMFVAVAAVVSEVRTSSDSARTAAGTAIGIALIPPLCVMGLGLGIRDLEVASGATMLFVTNLTAILFVSVVSFWALGFESVSGTIWERATIEEAKPGSPTLVAVRALQHLFGSRYSRIVRVALPALMIAAVIVPLSRALDEVAWEVSARNSVSRILDRATDELAAVQQTVSVKDGSVAIRLYVVGSADSAAALEQTLRSEIASVIHVEPTVRVIAVPDQGVLRQVRASVEPEPTVEETIRLSELRGRIDARLGAIWPAGQLGEMIGWHLEFPDSADPQVVIRHQGEPPAAAVEELLRRSLTESVGSSVGVRTIAYGAGGSGAALADATEWLPVLIRAADVARSDPGTFLCVRLPADPLLDGAGRRVADVARAEAQGFPAGRSTVRAEGDRWNVTLRAAPCDGADGAPAPESPAEPGS